MILVPVEMGKRQAKGLCRGFMGIRLQGLLGYDTAYAHVR